MKGEPLSTGIDERARSEHRPPPGSWPAARAAAKRLFSPVESFLAIEASSGLLLLLAAVIAMVWANSPWRSAYDALLHTPVGLRVGGLVFERDVHFWINDGLMVVFFFVVGLEIKREMYAGELSEVRRAALPAIAALGGMVVPACIYLVFNAGTPAAAGWGVPMATDIAFAVGILALLGQRVPPALRILLLALAVIDDLGAILIIALFYSSGVTLSGFVLAAIGIFVILGMQKLGVRSPWAYVAPAFVTWAGTYAAGVHPTIAGVVVGLLTPVRPWFGPQEFVTSAREAVEAVTARTHEPHHERTGLWSQLSHLNLARREAVAPVERLQHALHGWVAFGIMPLFALANAGVALGSARLEGEGTAAFLGVGLGLALGKPIGVMVFSWVAVRVGAAALPSGVRWAGVLVVGLVAGIGFTMALFIAALAFPPGPLIEVAKLGILAASTVSAVVGLVAGRLLLTRPSDGAARTAAEAEASTAM
jgi:NhaA family Na+:H+ antiporter